MKIKSRIDEFSKGRKIADKLHDLVPGGSHTYSKGKDQFPYMSPQIISHAKGAYCWDLDGNKFIDWAMGNRVNILGHSDSNVNNAVFETINRGLNFTRPSYLEYELAEFLTDLWPFAEMVKFGKNGSDCTHAAIKLCRAYTQKNIVGICKQHPFFGTGDWFISKTECNSGIPDEVGQFTKTFNYNDLESVEKLFEDYPNQVSCLILEPVKLEPPKCYQKDKTNCNANCGKFCNYNFLHKVKEIAHKNGALLIFDEMISGIRFDIKGAHSLFNIEPDIATFGKAISNGYSFSVLAGKKSIMSLGGLKHKKERVFLLSQTHSSESTGLAAALATIKLCIKHDVTSHVWKLGKKLKNGVNKLIKENNIEDHIKIIGYDCNPQIFCTHKSGDFWPELHTSFHEEVISHGVIIPWISITLSHNDDDVIKTFEAIDKGIKKIKSSISLENINESFVGDAVKPVFRKYN